MALKLHVVSCATCGHEIERVEYDDAEMGRRVAAVASALNCTPEEAQQVYLDRRRHPRDEAAELAGLAAAQQVEGADHSCPNGHTGIHKVEEL